MLNNYIWIYMKGLFETVIFPQGLFEMIIFMQWLFETIFFYKNCWKRFAFHKYHSSTLVFGMCLHNVSSWPLKLLHTTSSSLLLVPSRSLSQTKKKYHVFLLHFVESCEYASTRTFLSVHSCVFPLIIPQYSLHENVASSVQTCLISMIPLNLSLWQCTAYPKLQLTAPKHNANELYVISLFYILSSTNKILCWYLLWKHFQKYLGFWVKVFQFSREETKYSKEYFGCP